MLIFQTQIQYIYTGSVSDPVFIVIQLSSQSHLHKIFEIIANNQIITLFTESGKKPTIGLYMQVLAKENPHISVSSKRKKRLQKKKNKVFLIMKFCHHLDFKGICIKIVQGTWICKRS